MSSSTRMSPRVVGPAARVTVALAAALAVGASAQGQEAVKLGAPDATLAEPFSLVRGARELASGKLLLTDWIEQRLVIVDFSAGSVADLGRVGSGPEEFRLPGQLLPVRSDSTLLVDVGNSRVAVLDGAGRPPGRAVSDTRRECAVGSRRHRSHLFRDPALVRGPAVDR